MVDVRFTRRLQHFVPLALLQYIGAIISTDASNGSQLEDADTKEGSGSMVPDFVTLEGKLAIAGMQLLNRGRLSVQYVDQMAFDMIVQLGERGHAWDASMVKLTKSTSRSRKKRKAVEVASAPS
jgi:hypothetical protein